MTNNSDKLLYFVVGDFKLNSGNAIRIKNLEELSKKLPNYTIKGSWTLVLSIHGAENLIALVGGALKNPNDPRAYNATKIKKIFSNPKFVKWKNKYGPTRLVLNACQVNAKFEAVLIDSFTKPDSKQTVQGLGKGCRPSTLVKNYEYQKQVYDKIKRKFITKTIVVRTRNQYMRMPSADRAAMRQTLESLNRKYGYFGGPPVPKNDVLHYYFDEEPFGKWPVVTVSKDRKDTGITFYNRAQNGRFLGHICKQNIGPMRQHRPVKIIPYKHTRP